MHVASDSLGSLLVRNRLGERYAEPIDVSAHPEWFAAFDKLASMMGTGFLVAVIGKRGTGKTRIAAELIRRCGHSGRYVRYTTSLGFFDTLRQGFDKATHGGQVDTFKDFVNAGLLVIDDAHRRGDTEWRNAMLDELVGQRYNRRLDTLLISNETEAGFKAAIGLDIYSRITEAGGVMVCDWGSFRV